MSVIVTDVDFEKEAPHAVALVEWRLEGCLSDRDTLSQIKIAKSPFVVGRSSSGDLTLPSKNVSKRHAELLIAGTGLFVRDLSSSNGTYVNGRRIETPTPVGENDLLQFADMEFRLKKGANDSADHTAVSESPENGWMISRLHEFINERRFAMAFQPIVESRSRATVGYESLVRCQVPGMESPPQLFGAAVKLGLEERISHLCREEAVRALQNRPGRELLFVNTHPNEYLGHELIQSLVEMQPSLGERKLVLEVHESAVPDINTMREFRAALRDADIALAYDDFGAGQSRLLELSEVPPDYLKFDRSLVKNIGIASATQQALVASLLKVASDNGITSLAEGLDDDATVDACCEMGFELLQGYHLGRPTFVDQL